jgi:hypothetical protein
MSFFRTLTKGQPVTLARSIAAFAYGIRIPITVVAPCWAFGSKEKNASGFFCCAILQSAIRTLVGSGGATYGFRAKIDHDLPNNGGIDRKLFETADWIGHT